MPKTSEPTLSSYSSLIGPDVPPPEHLPVVTANESQSSLRRKVRPTIQHLKDKFDGNHDVSKPNEIKKKGSQLNGSGSKGSDVPKGERRRSRFAEWRKKNFGGGHKRRSSEKVSQASSNHKTESPKPHRGKNRDHS